MKKIVLILFISLCPIIALSQDLGIIPTPQQVEYQQGSFLWKADLSKNEKRIKTEIVKNIPANENKEQAYIIKITPKKIILQAMTEQGLFYARQSLNQLVKYLEVTTQKSEFEIPCMTITDWPALEYRGWMDDISRGPIPTMDFLKKDIRDLFTKDYPYIETKPKDEPPAKYNYEADVSNTIVGSGTIINGKVEDSILFRRVYIGEETKIKASIIMEDSYIGKNCVVEYAIIDKDVYLSDGKKIIGRPNEPIILRKGFRI